MMDHLFNLLEVYQPDKAVVEAQEWRPPFPFKVGLDIRATAPEVFADYAVLFCFILSSCVGLGVVVLHGF